MTACNIPTAGKQVSVRGSLLYKNVAMSIFNQRRHGAAFTFRFSLLKPR